jgi:hypothetical protein
MNIQVIWGRRQAIFLKFGIFLQKRAGAQISSPASLQERLQVLEGELHQLVGWIERFAKSIALVQNFIFLT